MNAFDRFTDALRTAGRQVQARGDGQAAAQCPAHDDRMASLSVTRSDTGVLINCFGGCDYRDVLAALNMIESDLFDATPAGPSLTVARPPRPRPAPPASEPACLGQYPDHQFNLSRETARYTYTEDGVTVGWRLRFACQRAGCREKTFRWKKPDPSGGETWGSPKNPPLYRLPDVLAALSSGQAVYVTEGEKDADALTEAGVTACTMGPADNGKGSSWKPWHTQTLRGAHVTVCQDRDAPGRRSGAYIAAQLAGVAASVRVVEAAEGKDPADHLAAGYGVADLRPVGEESATGPAPVDTEGVVRHRGHVRIAERVVRAHGSDLRHIGRLGWFTWDGSRWAEDEDDEPSRRVISTLKDAIIESADLDKEERRDLIDDVRKCESASGLEGVLRITGKYKPVATSHTMLDANPDILATPDGTVDLVTGRIRPNRREDHITKITAAGPGDQGADLWEPFLKRVLPDEDVRSFVQRLMGVALLGDVREQILPIFTGEGANGKGVFRDTLMYALGDYALEVDPALLMESKHERHGTYKMQLRGRRLVFTSETEKGRRFAEATMKRLTGGDPINANLMHRDAITFEPSHLLCMVTNHLPEVSGDDPAIWRRIMVVPFDVVIPVEERDPSLPRKLRAAAPAVLSWALEGLRTYQEQGLNPPEAVRVRTEAYKATSDVIARFLNDQCVEGAAMTVRANDLLAAYQRWCLENGEKPEGTKEFAQSMEKRGLRKKRTSVGQVYQGIGLYSDDRAA